LLDPTLSATRSLLTFFLQCWKIKNPRRKEYDTFFKALSRFQNR
jgi:hypothetical protein